jgi:hypothetical protein
MLSAFTAQYRSVSLILRARQSEPEAGAFTQDACHLNVRVVQLEKPMFNGQTEAAVDFVPFDRIPA